MKAQLPKLISVLLACFSLNAIAVTRYVDLNSPSPTPPYSTWATAATNIQDAIDVANAGDTVLVTNGVYVTGGRAVYGELTNRVAITKPIFLHSVNGPLLTAIGGYQPPGMTNGIGAVRCVYLTNGAVMAGFTLTNGATLNDGEELRLQRGGGIWCESSTAVVSNCIVAANSSASMGGGVFSGTVLASTLVGNTTLIGGGGAAHTVIHNSLIVSNSANSGGGAAWSQITGCTLRGNSALAGGGAYGGSLTNCAIRQNAASGGGGVVAATLVGCLISENLAINGSGGGVGDSLVYECMLTDNLAPTGQGGGAVAGTLERCVISNNFAGAAGGGSIYSDIIQSLVVSNRAWRSGGAEEGLLLNSVVVGNSAEWLGGGVVNCEVLNSIVYYNTALEGSNWAGVYAFNSCTTPLPEFAPGSFTNHPGFVDASSGNFRLHPTSPCINSGLNRLMTQSADFTGNPRIVAGTVDIGAYEFQSPSSVLSYAWAQQYALPTDGSADFTDPDADGMRNYGEWRSDTVPTDALSALRMVSATNGPTGANVTWQSVATRSYWLERATNLGVASPFETVATNVPGVAGAKTYSDTTATNGGPYFYRVGVQ